MAAFTVSVSAGSIASAETVTHIGEIFHDSSSSPLGFNVGGFDASLIHKHTGGGGGIRQARVGFDNTGANGIGALSVKNNVPIAYEWDIGSSFGSGTTATFNVAETVLFNDVNWQIDLLADGSQLTTTAGSFSSDPNKFNVTGSLGIRITDKNNGASLIDQVIFNMVMGSDINTVRTNDDETFNFILWGATAAFSSTDSDLIHIGEQFYGSQGLGIDLLFNGAPTAVPVPAALPLLGTALAGMVIVGRRRRKFTA